MSQDEHPQKCARARTKEGSNNAHGRHCADQARHNKREQTKSPFCVVLKTYHLTGNHHKTCLKHSNFLNRKLCVNCYPHGTPWQQQGDREPKEKQKTPQRVETRFKTRQLQHRNIVKPRFDMETNPDAVILEDADELSLRPDEHGAQRGYIDTEGMTEERCSPFLAVRSLASVLPNAA